MSKKIKFTLEEEEKIIDYVKSNEILYNVRHKSFRDSEAKNRLWLHLANEMNIDGEYLVFIWIFCLIFKPCFLAIQLRQFH